MRRHFAILTVFAVLHAAPASAQVKRAEILKEIQDAFKTWEAIACSNLQFKFEGELTSYISEKDGGIVVLFGHDNTTWEHMNDAYHTSSDFKLIDKGDLYKGAIKMNARDWDWSIGKSKNMIDIKTAVLHLIPGAIGFYVGADPKGGSLKAFIDYDVANHKLHALHERGAIFDYFKSGGSCQKVTPDPAICGMTAPPPPDAGAPDQGADAGAVDAATPDAATPDAAVDDALPPPPIQLCIHHSNPNKPAEGKPLTWLQQPIKYWVYIPNRGKLPGSTDRDLPDGGVPDGAVWGDGGPQKACQTDQECPSGFVCRNNLCVSPGGDDDDGCCRVSHTRSENIHGAILLLLGLGLLVVLRRRK